VPSRPAIAVTSTTEVIRDVLRVRANASYTDSALAAGLRPYILPVLAPERADEMLDGVNGLLLTGGEDVDPKHYGTARHAKLGSLHEERDAFELALVRAARRRKLPTLAICRGIQVANVALGGTLFQDLGDEWPGALDHDGDFARNMRVHSVSITPRSRLSAAIGVDALDVNSFHHQAVKDAAPGLTITATSPDGVVEGAEWTQDDWWFLAVQWHPEELTTTHEPHDRNLFNAFASHLRG
jgi:putative glutamine amidotransferase